MFVSLIACYQGQRQVEKIEGKTMGTTYRILFIPAEGLTSGKDENYFKSAIDSLLREFNNSVSTFIPASTISKVNKPDTLIVADSFFAHVFRKAQEVSQKTEGAFDITVMPLVNGWGFGFKDTLRMDSATVDSLKKLVDYRKVSLTEKNGRYFVKKTDRRIQVDFSAIAKGYGVDIVAMFLEKHGIKNYMVEIGGEVRAKGKNQNNEIWRIGISKPIDDPVGNNPELKAFINLDNKSLATSGNYRNYYYRNGKKVSHEINPKTGYPALNNLLSVTVMADDCMTADAYATAFMVMGMEKTMDYLKHDSMLEVYLIYSDEKGKMKTRQTAKMRGLLREVK